MFGSFIDLVLLLHLIMIPSYLYLTWNFKYWKKRGLRTALPVTIFGTFPSLVTRSRKVVYEVHKVYMRYKQHSRAIGVYVVRQPHVLIMDPKVVQEILLERAGDFWKADEKWKSEKTNIEEELTAEKLKTYADVWRTCNKNLKTALYEHVKNASAAVETRELARNYMATAFCSFMLNLSEHDFALAHGQASAHIAYHLDKYSKFAKSFQNFDKISPLLARLYELVVFHLFYKSTERFLQNSLEYAIKLHKKQADVHKSEFLRQLLQLAGANCWYKAELSHHILALLLDWYEAASNTLIHMLYYLAKHPSVQSKLRRELLASIGTNQENLSLEELSFLPYLDQCVYETLRLVTLVPQITWHCNHAIELQISPQRSFQTPQGTPILIPIYSFHHDPQYFTKPNEYNPERFDNGAHYKLIDEGIFLPFGRGGEKFIGRHLILLTVKSAISQTLLNFELKSCTLTQHEEKAFETGFLLDLNDKFVLEYTRFDGHTETSC